MRLGHVLRQAQDERMRRAWAEDGWIDLLALAPHERAAAGLFLGFQYPVEIPGVSTSSSSARRSTRSARCVASRRCRAGTFSSSGPRQADALGLNQDMLKRPVNVGFSGGEKKRNEMVQMGIIDPRLAILDETDSGLDIDALRHVGHGSTASCASPTRRCC